MIVSLALEEHYGSMVSPLFYGKLAVVMGEAKKMKTNDSVIF
jgi:hypothetical protein